VPKEETLGKIFRDPKSGWYIADYHDSSGTRRRHKVAQDAREARDMLALLEGKAVRDRCLDVKPLKQARFSEFAEEFLKYARTQMRAWKRYETSLGSLTPFFGNQLLTAIDAESIEKYKQRRVEKVEPSTVNRDLQCLRRMFNLAIVWRYATENPVKFVKFFRVKNCRVRYLTREEFNRLLERCPDALKSVVIVGVHTGMRQGELLALRWAETDLENGFASINDPKNGSPRKVPLNHTSRELLCRLHDASKAEKVFCDGGGDPYCSRTVQWQFRRAVKEAKIENFRFHDIRHTCASWLAMAGVPLLAIKEILGHKDIRMTLRYAHLAPDQRVDAVKLLDDFVAAPGKSLPSLPSKMGQKTANRVAAAF
jgi:integrase